MSWVLIFGYTFMIAVLGYMIGHDSGKQEGYLQGVADEYKAGQER